MAIIEGARSQDTLGGHASGLIITDVTLTVAQILALNATPIALLAAPGAGKAIIFEGAQVHKPAGTAYGGIAAGEDLSIKYTGAAGLEVGVLELTGFADQSTAQTRFIRPIDARDVTLATNAGAPSSINPVDNAVLAAHLLVGEIITGNSVFRFRIWHRIIDTVLA